MYEMHNCDCFAGRDLYELLKAPYALRNARFGTRFGVDLKLEDTLWAGLTDLYTKTPMGVTAENLAVKYGLTPEECNAHAIQTQQRWLAAHEAGIFDAEITPIELKKKKKVVEFKADEHPKPMTTVEQLNRLPPVFKKGGTVNAGNASGVCDGAAALVIASGEAVKVTKLRVHTFQNVILDFKCVGVSFYFEWIGNLICV